MINVLLVVYVLFAHWVADFVCQTDWMAKNKCHDNEALGTHVGVYTLVMSAFMGVGVLIWSLPNIFIWILLNGALHGMTDYITSRMTSKLWAQEKVHDFFVVVGADQFLHMAMLLLTLTLFV